MPGQSYTAGKFMLEIEGEAAGYLSTVEGGEPFASVVSEAADADGVVRKSPGPVAYESIRISFGNGMGLVLYRWMSDMLTGDQTAKNGAIVFHNYGGIEQSRIEFDNALITEITFPELDGTSKTSGQFELTLRPETTRVSKASAGTKGPIGTGKKQKNWSLQNFRLKLDDLPTSKVNRIEAITVKQTVTGDVGNLTLQPVVIPNVSFTVPQSDAKEFDDWFEDFVIEGDASKERSGTIEFLDSSTKSALFTLTLSSVGIIRIHRERSQQDAQINARVRVESYCEEMAFSSDDTATADAAPAGGVAGAAAAGGAATDVVNATATALAAAFLDAVGRMDRTGRSLTTASGNTPVEPELIAQRLQTSAKSKLSGAPALSKIDDGILIGGRWATDTATLEELEQIAALEAREWTAIQLERGHSLIAQLIEDAIVPPGDEGPLELERDSFVEGIVAGAAKVLRSAAPHLGQTRQK